MVLILLIAVGLLGVPGIALAAPAGPDKTININGGGHFSDTLVLKSTLDVNGVPTSFDNAAWFPGLAKTGIVRIQNSAFYKVKISNIALQVDGIAAGMYGTFAEKMKFTLKKVNDPAALYDGAFTGILYQTGSALYKGKDVSIEIDRLGYVDFEYTVTMDGSVVVEDNMHGLDSTLSLLINTGEIPAPSSGGDGGPSITTSYLISDMPPSHWAYQCVQTLLKNKTIELEPDNKIRPEDSITRAEVAVLLAKALGLEPVNKLFSGFIDLGSISNEVKGYIIAVSEAGIFHGYPGWRFMPNNHISREELACVLVRAFEKKLTMDITLGYTDRDQISDWALDDVKAAIQHKLMGGYPDNTFKPRSFMTRAEAFSIICRTQAE